jgi:hypothetical protein
MRLRFLGFACFWAVPAAVGAQGVIVAPHAVFMDHRTRAGFVELYNPEARPVEVAISLLFGYPVTDSLGHLLLFAPDTAAPHEPSATEWITVLPRRIVIPALTRQTIRLLGRPPPGLKDGEFWTRLVISAKGAALPVSGVDTTSGVQVGLTLEVRTIIPVYYRKGAVKTGVKVSELRTTLEPDSISVRARLVRTGNAVFLGTVRGTLLDSAKRPVAAFTVPLAVYFDLDPRFAMSRAGLAPGEYLLRLEVSAERTDIPKEQLLGAAPVRDSVTIVVR